MIAPTVRRTVRERQLLSPGDHVLVACSGGPDSTALVHVLHRLRRDLGVTLCVASIDHGLRAESASEVERVAAFAGSLGLPFLSARVELSTDARSIQAEARERRYEALGRLAASRSATRIAVGHTQDDQAETVLARLLRGAGLRGLGGIAPKRSDGVIRPLIDCRRDEVRRYVDRHDLPFVEDPSNHQRDFERVRIRHEVLPALLAEDPRVVEHLCALRDEAAELEGFLDDQTPDSLPKGTREVPIAQVVEMPAPIRIRWLRAWISQETGLTPSRKHLTELGKLVMGEGEVLLGSGWSVRREPGGLSLEYRARRRTRSNRS